MTVAPARRSALEILRRVETEFAYASVLLAALDSSMREDDRALCHELVLGVLRRKLWLDKTIEHFGERKIQKLDPAVRLALEIGLYQLRFLTRVPASAAVNESVNFVRASRVKSAAGFVNAVLRRATREPDYDPVTALSDPLEKLSIATSHPSWLIERWVQAFGFDEAAAFARANNQAAPTAVRFTAKAARDEGAAERVRQTLRDAGAEVIASQIAPDAWRVMGASHVVRELANEGLIYLQDEASQLLAHLLDVGRNQRVLDLTAAPGSKATHIAALAPSATIVAGEIHPHRVETMRRLAAKQEARIHMLVHDATKPLSLPDESFDRVLLDAPCAGTGTLRRNPEIRYRLKPDHISELADQQKQMLACATAVVRPGGRLVYSTCSVEPEENEQVVDHFASANPDFRRIDLSAAFSSFIPHPSSFPLRLWPHRQGCDGFFITAYERVG
ncbi:MAG TPA: 16S rRNA (cytosine(967)-C(5))-methyltransferase RsmB [Pyrinomonadaceae bacterium]|nr:16S rRNA (cytosine(967)-C(5))-methyltransferase RsmB [Pyrinomonadaceae bacterium]